MSLESSFSSNENMLLLEEPLLIVCNHPQHDHDPCGVVRHEGDHCNAGPRQRQANSWANPSPLSSSSRYFFYIRPKFVLVGFLFGALMEFMYDQSIRFGWATLQDDNGGTMTATTTTTSTSIQEEQHHEKQYSVKMETWTDVFFYELSFLYADAVFLIYLLVLTRYALKKKLTLSLPIMAANWTMGMMLGVSVAVACLVGPKVVLQQRVWKILGSMVIAMALCFVVYATALEMQTDCLTSAPQQLSWLPSWSCCDHDNYGILVEEEQETNTRSRSDDVHEDDDRPTRTTISLIEAHIV